MCTIRNKVDSTGKKDGGEGKEKQGKAGGGDE